MLVAAGLSIMGDSPGSPDGAKALGEPERR
jgi:hypothetical protein